MSPRVKPPGSNPLNESAKTRQPNWFVRAIRAVFGYRKTSLTFLVALVLFATVLLSAVDNSLEWTVSLPSEKLETTLLDNLWDYLQKIALVEHTYTSPGNDYVHDVLERRIKQLVAAKKYAEYDNDLNKTNNVMFSVNYLSYDSVSYYESNNLLVRVNGTNPDLPAFLVSAHYDSVPSSYGVTDDGMGVASLLGLLEHLTNSKTKQPKRTVIFNFNNNEEFGLYGATAFLDHPWFKQIKYFLNLEGTGAGGKAVLFRGTDYGIVKHFSNVRYPYATSLFQQGFNNKLIHSETDYAVYKGKGGLRGLDLAFYKPRDIYHTGGDNIKNVNKKSLWHMLSSTLDFTKFIAFQKIDLDDEYLGGEKVNTSTDYAAYLSFLNFFFSAPLSQVVIVNVVLLVIAPIVSLLFLVLIFHYKKGWGVNVVNVIKFPISFVLSIIILSFITDVLVVPTNLYLVNSSPGTLVATLFAVFLLLNYAFLNGLNFVFKPFKGHQHDEKLIVIIEASFITWILLLWSTEKQAHNKIGDDHTGEFFITVLFVLQAVASLFGLFGWSLKSSKRGLSLQGEDSRPLLGSSSQHQYNSNDDESFVDSDLSSLQSGFEETCKTHENKSFSYDWLIQFLIIAPISSLLIYNSGWLLLAGINKSIQESLQAQEFIYKILQAFVIVWSIPFLPFIFKLNRVFVLVLVIVLIQGGILIGVKAPFDVENPLKLRFLETINLNTSPASNFVTVSGRLMTLIEQILKDIPSFKDSKSTLISESVGDGMLLYSYGSDLSPKLVPGVKKIEDYLSIDVLQNSSSGSDSPFGLLTGEVKITAPKNRNCKVSFNVTDKVIKIYDSKGSSSKRSPVRTVIVYKDEKADNLSSKASYQTSGFPEGFSRDSQGNYVYKDFEGIGQLQLNKLDWDKTYHIAFQWVPEVVDSDAIAKKINVKKLGVNVECYWSGSLEVEEFSTDSVSPSGEQIPAYKELLHYSPNYVKWANRDRGLVSVTKYVEI